MPALCSDLPEDDPRSGWPWWTPVIGAAVAAGILGLSLLQGDGFTHHPQAARLAVAAVALLPWLLHIVVPLPRGVLEAVTLACVAWLGWHHSADAAWFLPIAALSQCLVLWGTPTGIVYAAAIFGVLTWESVTDPYGATPSPNWVGWYMGTLAGFAGGWGTRKQRALVSELRNAQAELANQSALGERQRIAREIHDVIAHSLTVTMLHLSAARLAVRSDPAEAEEALREAERVGRQSLADVRRTVDLLGSVRGDGESVPAPLPGAADIAALVEQLAAAGLDARLQVRGDPTAVAPATGLGLYRIAQESLSNVVKHAPGAPVVVDLDINAESVCLRVRNGTASGAAAHNGSPVAASPGGFGLGGMAQRATLLGGAVEAGPDGDGWQVTVRVPSEVAPAELPS